jgi:peptide deformylase
MIITDESKLRLDCSEVTLEEYSSLKDQLERELRLSAELGHAGIGLAAPQIGIAKRMAIIRLGDDFSVDLVNCKIKKGYDKAIFENEGCLSFPDRFENTFRYQEIEVVDNLIWPYSFISTGLMAVACQHELDHLVGKLLFDNAISNNPIKKVINHNIFK